MFSLPPQQVDCWCLPVQPLALPDYRALLAALPPDEQARHEEFYFPQDQLRYLLTRTLVRRLLERYLGVPASELVFRANAYGRPALAAEHNHLALDFNLSHSADYVVCALTRTGQIGVDVEGFARQRDLHVADDFFAPSEVEQLLKCPAEARNRRFVEFWTLKEAFIKAVGHGLAIPLDAFCFELSPDGPQLHDPAGWGGATYWQFLTLESADAHLLSLAAATHNAEPVVWQIRPFGLKEAAALGNPTATEALFYPLKPSFSA